MTTHSSKAKTVLSSENCLVMHIFLFDILDAVALSKTDDQAAEQLQKERSNII